MNTKIFGIKNCNTMKKTFQLFEAEGVAYEFIDYKKQKPDVPLLKQFIDQLGLETVINKKGTTYRKLDEGQKKALETADTAIPVLIEKSSMIKRPIIAFENGELLAGFEDEKIKARIK